MNQSNSLRSRTFSRQTTKNVTYFLFFKEKKLIVKKR